MNVAEKNNQLRRYVEQIAPEGGLERIADDSGDTLESMAPRTVSEAEDAEVELANTAIRKVAVGDEINEDEMFALEAIILPDGRPVLDVEDDSFTAPKAGLWTHLGEDVAKTNIDRAIPAVGRIELPNDLRLPYGGTGFAVSPTLIMTNRHVAELFASGLGINQLRFRSGQTAVVDFKQEREPSPSIPIDVQDIVMVHPYWDMALLRVGDLSAQVKPLTLSVADPGDLNTSDIVVIGYPAFDPRNQVELQNRIFGGVFNVKRLQPGKTKGRQTVRSFGNQVSALKHDASTLGGNSGSAVVDIETGEVVALHFAGRYLESNWAVPTHELARDSFVVDAGANFAGNITSGPVLWSPQWQGADPPSEISAGALSSALAASSASTLQAETGVASWHIPLQIDVSFGTPIRLGATSQLAAVSPPVAEVEKPGTIPDPDYANREGYDPNFLGHGHEVKIPWLSDEQYSQVALNREASSDHHVLPYHHFSVVMNGDRKIAFFTAVNMDGNTEKGVRRSDFRDVWSVDPRVEAGTFLDNEFYRGVGSAKNPLDRGHLVRRLDPCWGENPAEVQAANHDTFHWTNCSPQHENFNRNKTTWGGVENHILHGTTNNNLRVSVFTGPVFRDDDPVYTTPTNRDVRLPREYWKVVVMVDPSGELSATGFVLSQGDLIDDLVEFAFVDKFEQFQTTVASIEEMTGLSFLGLAAHDPLGATEEGPGGVAPRIALESLESVVL